MKRKEQDLFSVSLVGLGICAIAFTMGFTVFRENRLAKGISVMLWESAGPMHIILILTMLAAIIGILVFRRRLPGFSMIVAVLGNIFIFLIFIALADSAKNLTIAAADYSRVSLGPGAWILLLGGYIIMTAASKSSKNPFFCSILSILFIIIILVLVSRGMFNRLSIIQELIAKKSRFIQEFINHLSLAFSSVGFAIGIGIPLGILAYRKRRTEKSIFFFVNTTQTIPSLALFGLLLAPLSFLSTRFPFLGSMGIHGIGTTPALIALTLYALLPVTRTIYTSLKAVDPSFIQAGKGMGLSRIQLLFTIEIPLAAPILLNGLRLAAVQAIGNTTVAALIGAGGFGFFIFQGLGQAAADLILLGAIPVVLLAIIADRLMQLLINILTPKGIQLSKMNVGGTG